MDTTMGRDGLNHKNFKDIFIPLQNKDSKEISKAICNVFKDKIIYKL